MKEEQTVFERYRKELYRIGWRVQYRAKSIRRKEVPIHNSHSSGVDTTQNSENRIYVNQILNSLPEFGRSIMYKLYIEGYSEKEIAIQLDISQQAVSKWKQKMINHLSQTVNL
ncbi:terminase gpP N-terminus-related DNA-binding protein [Paenibacillus sp. QZ-Y1]|uniref:terminase gpP N-terminus-related DNA-binding protein n=1 Tax=Paenibacillus sp. QZ-Y1 TaxID=3414511 RepID=UPI003F78E106